MMSNIQLKGFFWSKLFGWKKISKSTPNDPKGEKNGRRSNSVRRTDRTDRSAKPATVFSRFWSFGVIKTEKKTVAGQIRSAGRSGRPTDRQNRRPFFTFWIIRSRFGKRIFQPKFFNFKIMIWHYIEVKKRFSPDGFSQNTGDYFYCFRNSIFKMVPHSTLELSLDWIGKHILCSKILFNTCMSP